MKYKKKVYFCLIFFLIFYKYEYIARTILKRAEIIVSRQFLVEFFFLNISFENRFRWRVMNEPLSVGSVNTNLIREKTKINRERPKGPKILQDTDMHSNHIQISINPISYLNKPKTNTTPQREQRQGMLCSHVILLPTFSIWSFSLKRKAIIYVGYL